MKLSISLMCFQGILSSLLEIVYIHPREFELIEFCDFPDRIEFNS